MKEQRYIPLSNRPLNLWNGGRPPTASATKKEEPPFLLLVWLLDPRIGQYGVSRLGADGDGQTLLGQLLS